MAKRNFTRRHLRLVLPDAVDAKALAADGESSPISPKVEALMADCQKILAELEPTSGESQAREGASEGEGES